MRAPQQHASCRVADAGASLVGQLAPVVDRGPAVVLGRGRVRQLARRDGRRLAARGTPAGRLARTRPDGPARVLPAYVEMHEAATRVVAHAGVIEARAVDNSPVRDNDGLTLANAVIALEPVGREQVW